MGGTRKDLDAPHYGRVRQMSLTTRRLSPPFFICFFQMHDLGREFVVLFVCELSLRNQHRKVLASDKIRYLVKNFCSLHALKSPAASSASHRQAWDVGD